MSKGYIYILINPSLEKDLLKIGRTTRKPEERASELCTTGVPAQFYVAYDEEVEDCHLAESLLHQKLANYRYDQRREFFKLPLKTAIEIVRQVTASMPAIDGLVSWNKQLLVARWSRFFQVLGITYDLVGSVGDGEKAEFVPSFWLPSQDCWIGLGENLPTEAQRSNIFAFSKAQKKIVFALLDCAPIVIRDGNPLNSIQYFTPEGGWDGCMEFGICPCCQSRHIGHFGSHGVESGYDTDRGCEYKGQDFTRNALLVEAYEAARAIKYI